MEGRWEKNTANHGLRYVQTKMQAAPAGFARGMLGAMQDKNATHVLLMDDDVEVKPSALEKTYTLLSLLKEEYADRMVGGGVLRSDYTFVTAGVRGKLSEWQDPVASQRSGSEGSGEYLAQ